MGRGRSRSRSRSLDRWDGGRDQGANTNAHTHSSRRREDDDDRWQPGRSYDRERDRDRERERHRGDNGGGGGGGGGGRWGRSRSRSRERMDRYGGGGGGGGGDRRWRDETPPGGSRGGGGPRDRDRERDRGREHHHHHHHHHHHRSKGGDGKMGGGGGGVVEGHLHRDEKELEKGKDKDLSKEKEKKRPKEEERKKSSRHTEEPGSGSKKEKKRDGKASSSSRPSGGEKDLKQGHKESSSSSRKEKDKQKEKEKKVEEEDDDDAPLELDEESMRLLVGGGMGDEEEEERLIAERKRKREEIEALHRKKEEAQAEKEGTHTHTHTQQEEGEEEGASSSPLASSPSAKKKMKGNGAADKEKEEEDDDDEEEEEEDGPIDVRVHNKPLTAEEAEQDAAIRGGQPEPSEEPEFLLDMFSLSPSKALAAGGLMMKPTTLASAGAAMGQSLEDNWDDHEGYYKTLVGEMIAERYLVLGSIGRGVFSTVLKCQDKKEGDAVVAVKIIRNNDVMRKAAQRELDILRAIATADPENRKHCVRLLHHLEHRNHVVLVFESLQMNLRETLRKFGKHVGLNIAAVRTYAKQLLVALRHIANLGIVHADIKPDNILVSEGFSQLKLCDFGSAFKEDAPDNDPTPYLVSRFYRAPEIILGFEYGRPVDLWSIGCCLYELFTGRVAFPGVNNNDMLRLMMEVKGGLPQKVVRRHRAAYEQLQLEPFFEADGRFRQEEPDPVSKKVIMRLVHITKPARELTATLMKAKAASDDRVLVGHLADLLEKIFIFDASKRITIKDALHHPFVSASSAAAAVASGGGGGGGGK